VVERFASRIPLVGGVFIQMEDELASSIAIQGRGVGRQEGHERHLGPGLSS